MSGRLSYQHNYSRLVADEYFILYDAGNLEGPELNECLLARSRGVKSLSKEAEGHYRIVFSKSFPISVVYDTENNGGAVNIAWGSGLVFCNAEHNGTADGTLICRSQWVRDEGILVNNYVDTLDIFTYWQTLVFSDPNYLVELATSPALAPVYVTVHRPLHPDIPTHLTGQVVL